jgi:lysophospholipase L1-like esterase
MNRINGALLKYALLLVSVAGFLSGFSQGQGYPYASDIRRFMVLDSINPPPQHAILFAGSSSFTLWQDVQDYFPGFTIINRGFGGSTLPDQIHYADEVIFPCSPRQIVIYCGENDLAYSDSVTPEMVIDRFRELFNLIRSELPDVKVTYISMKPSPSRWHLAEKFINANFGIRMFLEFQENVSFVNVWDRMLDSDLLPDPSLFREDMLHMNEKGYRIWQKAIEPHLIPNY